MEKVILKENESVCMIMGRFQPFHKVHITMLDHALNHYDKVVVLISNHELDENNWFTYEQRKCMIETYLDSINCLHQVIFGVVESKLKDGETKTHSLCTSFIEVVGGVRTKPDCLVIGYDKLGKEFMKDLALYGIDLHIISKKDIDFCATDIRKLITENKLMLSMIPSCNHHLLLYFIQLYRVRNNIIIEDGGEYKWVN